MAAEILAAWGPGETRLALVQDGIPVEFHVARPGLLQGALILGRVVELAPKLEAAFVDIGTGRPGFLPHVRDLTQGQAVMVRVRADAHGSKGATLSMDTSLPGRFLAYSPARPGLNLSRRLDPADSARLHALLAPQVKAGEGVVVRTAAARAAEAELAAELQSHRAAWAGIEAKASGKAPVLLWQPCPVAALLADHPGVEAVWVDDAATFADMRRLYGAVVKQTKGSAFALHDAGEEFEQALEVSVPLPCGGRVTFESTAALTAIDVDSGGAAAAEANAQAVEVIARQLRLRSLAGQMAVDFVSGGGKGAMARLAEKLKRAVAPDPVPTHVFGVSPLGLVELTRERRGPSLAGLMQETTRAPAAEAAALAALRLAVAEAAHRPGRALALVTAPEVAAWLSAHAAAVAEAESRIGRALAIRPESGRARENSIVEEV